MRSEEVYRKARKGLRNPAKAYRHIVRKFRPDYGMDWRKQDGVVTWDSFEWGAGDDPAEVSAVNNHLLLLIDELIGGQEFGHALDAGCGYGRMTPIFRLYSEEVHGVDFNREMLDRARDHHPGIDWRRAKLQDLPFEDGLFDLVFFRSVLHHVPPDQIEEVCREVSRVTSDEAVILFTENTEGDMNGDSIWSRSIERYEELFHGFSFEEKVEEDYPWKEQNNTQYLCKLVR